MMPETPIRYGHKRVAMVEVDANELLCLLDHVDDLVRFCSCNMPNVERYYRGANATWAIAQRLAGNDEAANELIVKLTADPNHARFQPEST